MRSGALTLTVFFDESDRRGGHLLSDALLDLCESRGVRAAVLLRATEGFGARHRLHAQGLLTLSEDLPLVLVAVDAPEPLEALASEVRRLLRGGLVTQAPATLLDGSADVPGEDVRLTVFLGRDERYGGRPAYLEVVDHLHARGLAGATVLLGVDGTLHRERSRARFFSRNAGVPLLVVAVGGAPLVAAALPGLRDRLADPVLAVESVVVCRRDGVRLARPGPPPGAAVAQRLTVYTGEQARFEGRPLASGLLRRLRLAGAGGVTTVRGIRGFSGDHAPHGDRLFRLRRAVPVVTTIVDSPERCAAWSSIVDELTAEAGLVTSQYVTVVDAPGAAAPLR